MKLDILSYLKRTIEIKIVFEDVSHETNRRSEVWKSFLLDKENNQAKCKECLNKNINKIFSIKNGNTKTLLDHLRREHTEKNEKPTKSKKNFFENL